MVDQAAWKILSIGKPILVGQNNEFYTLW